MFAPLFCRTASGALGALIGRNSHRILDGRLPEREGHAAAGSDMIAGNLQNCAAASILLLLSACRHALLSAMAALFLRMQSSVYERPAFLLHGTALWSQSHLNGNPAECISSREFASRLIISELHPRQR